MTEIWKDVPGYEGLYLVSSAGRVVGLRRGLQKPCIDRYGYERTSLSKDGKMKSFYVHRLVAMAFIPNPEQKETVNHKDENKLNNAAENLEWASAAEQNAYGTRTERAVLHSKRTYESRKKPVIATDAAGHEHRFPGIVDAVNSLGVQKASIQKCCRGEQKAAGGFMWRKA